MTLSNVSRIEGMAADQGLRLVSSQDLGITFVWQRPGSLDRLSGDSYSTSLQACVFGRLASKRHLAADARVVTN
jgi:hypothetical protein